jgi:short-subunit dehydrogenase
VNKAALITGVTSGIGLELARLLAADGYELVLVSRDEQRLRKVAAELSAKHRHPAKVLARDLSSAGSAEEVYRWLREQGITVEILINNAGFGLAGAFLETDLQQEIAMIQLNVVSLMVLTKLLAREMSDRKRGKILNVASTAAFQPGPFMAVYYATKGFVLSFSEALAEELKDTGVTVTALCPGPTATEFSKRADASESKLFSSGMIPLMNAAVVAQIGYQGLMRGQRVVIPGLINRIGVQLARLSPRRLVTLITRILNTR